MKIKYQNLLRKIQKFITNQYKKIFLAKKIYEINNTPIKSPVPKIQEIDRFTLIDQILTLHKIKTKKDDKHLFGSIGGEVVVIFQENETTKLISVHFRASIFPNESALISSLLFPSIKNLKLGDTFEITIDGKWLFGEKALKYAADNMPFLWFGPSDEYDKKEILRAMEESKNIDKNLLN